MEGLRTRSVLYPDRPCPSGHDRSGKFQGTALPKNLGARHLHAAEKVSHFHSEISADIQ